MEGVDRHRTTIMFKQCYCCEIIYGHEEVPTSSGRISHGLCGHCLPKEKARLGLEDRDPIVLAPPGQP